MLRYLLDEMNWVREAYLCLLTYARGFGIIRAMRTTIDIPDVLYRAVRSRTAAEGTTLRNITIALYGDWMQRADWHPQLRTEAVITDDKPEAKPNVDTRPHLKCFGILKPKKHINGPHDMESIRASIAEGRKKEYAELLARRGFV